MQVVSKSIFAQQISPKPHENASFRCDTDVAEKGKIYVQTLFLETPPKNLGGEKSGVNVLGQNSVRGDFNISDLSTTEINRVVSSKQKKKTNPIEARLDFDRLKSRSSAEVNHFIFRIYGCGVCDQMFDVEEVFLEHCHHH